MMKGGHGNGILPYDGDDDEDGGETGQEERVVEDRYNYLLRAAHTRKHDGD